KLTDPVRFTLVKFNSSHTNKVYGATPINDVIDLTDATYVPDGGTPLIDAAVKLIHATADYISKNFKTEQPGVQVVIQTDGEENSSREYSYADLTALIKEKEGQGWSFVFIGAGIDAYSQSAKMGFSVANTMSYDPANTAEAFATVSASTA